MEDEQYPHLLSYMITDGGGIDTDTGNPIPSVESWSGQIACRYEPPYSGSRPAVRTMPDMTVVTYSYNVYMPKVKLPVTFGTMIRLFNRFGEHCFEGTCKGFEYQSENSRLWV
jgi:hypothetical protein